MERYIARAVAHGRGYRAQYGFPGVALRYVTPRDSDQPCSYASALDAEHDARRVLLDAMNNRPRQSKLERYRRMTGAEFAEAVRAAGITPTFFCYLWGTDTKRFFQWADETPDKAGTVVGPPHGIRVLLETWRRFPTTIDLAESVTDQVTTERKPRRIAAE